MKSVEPEDAEGVGGPNGSEESDTSATESALDYPEWDNKHLDRVAERLMHNYNLQRERAARGERFDLLGPIRMEGRKQLFHRLISYANHHMMGYMPARRIDTATVAELEWLAELDHALTDEWIGLDEEHYGMEFTFVFVADTVPEEARAFISDLVDRTLLKFGYYGHYGVNLAIIVPSGEGATTSCNAGSAIAFTL